MGRSGSLWRAIGPGILFAGAAIGVSHLVQATSAGAGFGLWLLPAVLLAHAAKYPSMVFAPRYAAATGGSLVDAYGDQGRWALAAFALVAVGTSFTVLAAVTLVAAAVVRSAVGLEEEVHLPWVALGSLTLSGAIMAMGGFAWLDRLLKGLMVLLLAATVAAVGAVLPRADWSALATVPAGLSLATVVVVVKLVGWMPAPLDITVWHSLWTLDKAEHSGHRPTGRQCRIDFNIGYALCVVTACCFLLLGAVVLYQEGVAAEQNAIPFVAQLFGLYTDALGEWVWPLIALAASAVMVSTQLAVFDALPRAAEALTARVRRQERPVRRTRVYWLWALVFSAGAMAIILQAGAALKPLVDLATAISFLGTPVLAWLNHRAITSERVPDSERPGRGMRAYSLGCVLFWAAFAALYIALMAGELAGAFSRPPTP